jgi:HEAT repeat protein
MFEREAAQNGAVRAARVRLERVLGEATTASWFERLTSSDPAVRLATAKGLWKLRDVRAIDALLTALEREEQPELRVAFALNLLLASAEVRVGRTRWNRLAAVVFPTLREGRLSDEREDRALREVYAGLRRWDSGRTRGAQSALSDLARLWEE